MLRLCRFRFRAVLALGTIGAFVVSHRNGGAFPPSAHASRYRVEGANAHTVERRRRRLGRPQRQNAGRGPPVRLNRIDCLNFVEGQRRIEGPLHLPRGWLDLAFADASLPIHVDVGCGYGAFCHGYAKRNPAVNVLGLELMQRKVEDGNVRRRQLALPNCFFLLCDITAHLSQVLDDIQQEACLQSVSVQFPVPELNRARSEERVQVLRGRRALDAGRIPATRLFTDSRVNEIAEALVPGGFVFLQSEVEDVVQDMRSSFRNCRLLQDVNSSVEDWLPSNPMGVQTEWEESVLKNGKHVQRCLLRKHGEDDSAKIA